VGKRTKCGIRTDRSGFALSKSFLKMKIRLPGWGDTLLGHEPVIGGGKLDHVNIVVPDASYTNQNAFYAAKRSINQPNKVGKFYRCL
jgi:hypothetical protein